ncbi:MAG: tRNA uridine-5-carboxymethylaminomethyl(34) synthesis GTPase MnmE [Paraprevotella sp.]|nr:tRNA uridine-5-carboxymethylaminomethyl(34) synthesis GTPase MnmE [Paraprevotella sp.]
MNIPQNTICAIATAPGGAIGIIRISGPESIRITDRIFTSVNRPNLSLSNRKAYTLTFGHIKNENGDIIDEVLVSLFKSPHSYTGEDCVEISCHGSSYILQQVMQLLIRNGCKAAGPGEFTQRAFLNGKMDLSQAEAVADLISSSSSATHRMAMNQMRGGFSRELSALRDKLLHLTSLMELELDFSDHEELEFADRSELIDITQEIEHVVSRLVQSFSIGNVLKNGIPVAIIGETNAGKSTLLNTLLNEEKAIVSNIHGTTRDVIEDTVNIGGITFRFIDTAGIRDTNDAIECMGISRSYDKMEQANIILWVVDSTNVNEQIEKLSESILPHCANKPIILLLNKSDQVQVPKFSIPTLSTTMDILTISAKEKTGIHELQELLVKKASVPEINSSDIIITNARHYEALSYALEDIHRIQSGLQTGLSGDLISQDLRNCLFHLAEIVGGEITTDEILGNIFKHFCIGK